MPLPAEIIIAVLLVAGGAFALIGSYGLLRLPDYFMRLHGPTKASTLGLGAILLASIIFFSLGEHTVALHEILISIFLFITAPASAHILAKTAMHKRLPYRGGQEDPLLHPANIIPQSVGELHAAGLDIPPESDPLPGEER